MVHVKYIGPKEKKGVEFPIGVKKRTEVKQVLYADPLIKLSEQDAKLLLETFKGQFEIVSEDPPTQKKSRKKAEVLIEEAAQEVIEAKG